MKGILSTCGGCGCGCGVYLYGEEGRIKNVVPVRIHPASKGNLCIKGWNIHQSINSSERLKKPLIRRNGTLQEATWEEAIDFAVKGFKKILKREGGKGIGVIGSQKITNEENYSLMKFTRTVLGTNNIDLCGRFYCFSLQSEPFNVFYGGSIYDYVDELQENDIVFIIGANPSEENPQIGARILKALRRGVKLFIVNPRKIQFGLFSEVYLKNIPGSEIGVINSILRLILEGREDTEERELFEFLELYNQKFIEELSGVNFEELKKIAEDLKKPVKKLILFSSGLVSNEFFSDSVNSILYIAKLTASKVYSLGSQNNFRGAIEMGVQPGYLTDYQSIAEVRKKFEKAWGRSFPDEAGLNVFEMLEEALKYALKGMHIVGENIVVSAPDTNRTKRALSNLEFLVVQDIFMSETAQFADVILPASSFAEKDGTFTNLEGRVQRVRKVIEPRFESKPDLQILNLLEVGFGRKPKSDVPTKIMKEISSLSPHYKNVSYKELDKGFGVMVDFPPNGKVPNILPIEKRYVKTPESPDIEYPYYLITENIVFCHTSSTFSKHSSILRRELPRGEAELNPKDARELDVRAGQMVKIISRRGELILPVKINPEILAGTVFIPLNFISGNSNILTGAKVDMRLKLAGWKFCTVRLEKL